MNSSECSIAMKPILVAMLIGLVATPAVASPALRKSPDFAKDSQALPTLVGASGSIAAINRALAAANAARRADIDDCRRDAPPGGFDWTQTVDATLLGARFVSFHVTGSNDCGGAHPNFVDEAYVFDLKTGRAVDWNRLLPPSWRGKSAALKAAFIAEAQKEGFDADCKEPFEHDVSVFTLWPDAKAKGLAIHAAGLPHAVEGVCGAAATIPVEAMRRLGFDPALVEDVERGGYMGGP